MTLHRINSLGELVEFVPQLVKLKTQLKELWDDCNETIFVQKLIKNFDQGLYFGEFRGDELLYFYVVLPGETSEQAWVWLIYHNKKFYTETRTCLNELVKILRSMGLRSVLWASSILTSSYNRWVEKRGGTLYAKIYKMEF